MDRTLWMSAAETAFNKAEAAMLGWDVKRRNGERFV